MRSIFFFVADLQMSYVSNAVLKNIYIRLVHLPQLKFYPVIEQTKENHDATGFIEIVTHMFTSNHTIYKVTLFEKRVAEGSEPVRQISSLGMVFCLCMVTSLQGQHKSQSGRPPLCLKSHISSMLQHHVKAQAQSCNMI